MTRIHVYCWTNADGHCVKSYTVNGAYIKTFSVQELHDWNNVLAIDEDNNVYTITWPPGDYHRDSLRCYNKDGTLLYNVDSEEYDSIYAVCIGPDGYIYTLEWIAALDNTAYVVKRAPGVATVLERKKIEEPTLCQGFIMDSNKNIYMEGSSSSKTVKYNYDDTSPLPLVAYSTSISVYQRTLAVVNGVLAIGKRGDIEIKTAELDLSAYINESLDIATMQEPVGVGNLDNDLILCGYDNVCEYAMLGRYSSDGTKKWEANIGTYSDTTVYQIAAKPFMAVLDFTGEPIPIIPIPIQYRPPSSMFYYREPYPKRGIDELRLKCRVFLNNSVEYALVLNHNIRVLKAFMQDLGAFSAFRFAIPTQHLDALANQPLDLGDFKAIINNFINNNISNFMNVNYNFTLVRDGLVDYIISDDQGFMDIKVKSRIITDREPDVEMLKGTVDALSVETASNYTAIQHNLQVVKAILT